MSIPVDISDKAQATQLLICDVDGVLTDGSITMGHPASELKTFHVHDGLGLKLLQQSGIQVAIITSRQSPIVEARMRELGIQHVYQGQKNKLNAFETILGQCQLTPRDCAYIGDDFPDLTVMTQVGLSIAVANAVPAVKEYAHWVTEKTGGQGAVREVCELILQCQQKFEPLLAHYITPSHVENV